MDSLGDFLKRGREEAGVSLEELAGKTRIRLENLRALEKEELDELPSDLYVRGFVKLVCRELGLAPEEGLLRYRVLKERSTPPDEMTWAEERAAPDVGALERALENPDRVIRAARAGARWFGRGVALAAGVLLVVVGVRFVDRVVTGRAASQEAAEPRRVASSGGVSDRPRAASERAARRRPPRDEEAAPASSVSATPARAAAGASSAGPPASGSAGGDATGRGTPGAEAGRAGDGAGKQPQEPVKEAPAAPAATGKEVRAEPAQAAADTASSAEEPARKGARPFAGVGGAASGTASSWRSAEIEFLGPRVEQGKTLELEVRALRDVRVAVLLEGQGVAREADLAAGDVKRWKAKRLFLLSASDAGAVQVALQGKDLGVLGANGDSLVWSVVRPRNR
jgi:cytoskeleton protein RodZ